MQGKSTFPSNVPHLRKNIALLEDFQASPACPSQKREDEHGSWV
jgi:hypothetical protein